MITNDQIVTLAALMNDDDQFATFEREIAQLDTPNIMLVRFVSKLLEGKQLQRHEQQPGNDQPTLGTCRACRCDHRAARAERRVYADH
jgi:hypothetical protein